MESLRWQLFEKYGSRARIIRAERIQTGGLFGMGATTSYEVSVEVDGNPEPGAGVIAPARLQAGGTTRRSAAPKGGIRALLAEADNADGLGSRPLAAAVQKPDFDDILGELVGLSDDRATSDANGAGTSGRSTARAVSSGSGTAAAGTAELAGMARATPRPSQRPGDLIILTGLREQPLHMAWSMAGSFQHGADLLTAGDHRSGDVGHVFLDSVGIKNAQTRAASAGKPLLIAFSFGQRGSSKLSVLASVRPDQLWLVVNAAHKPDDTGSWVRRACRYAVPDALAVVGATDTATPETVNELQIPVGWVDGRQSTSTEL